MSETQPAIEAQLDLAAQVQLSLLPKANCCMAGWESAFAYEPFSQVSGDYLDIIEPGPDAFYFVLGDVSGKGVAASLLMAHLHATIRTLLASHLALEDVMRETSRTFCQDSLPAQFATLVLGKAQRSGEIQLVNAGHTPVVFVRRQAVEEIAATGIPLGLFCETNFAAARVTASPNDMLLLYTDGLTEAVDQDGSAYGTERLQRLLLTLASRHPRDVIRAIREDLRTFSSSQLADDLSLLALRFLPGPWGGV